jgi:hypothetical protein
MLSIWKVEVGMRKGFDAFRGKLLWQEDQGITKYDLMKCETVWSPKDLGGPCVPN